MKQTEILKRPMDLLNRRQLLREEMGKEYASYTKEIQGVVDFFKSIEKDPLEFAKGDPLLRALYRYPPQVRNEQGKVVECVEYWLALGDFMTEEVSRINSCAGKKATLEYVHADRDSDCLYSSKAEGIILRAGLETYVGIRELDPYLVVENGTTTRQYRLDNILLCDPWSGGLRKITIPESGDEKVAFPSRELIQAHKIAKEAFDEYKKVIN